VRYWWNDKEVSVEEYHRLNEEWKKSVAEQELQEKNSGTRNSKKKKVGS
jgi:hypothetical protein